MNCGAWLALPWASAITASASRCRRAPPPASKKMSTDSKSSWAWSAKAIARRAAPVSALPRQPLRAPSRRPGNRGCRRRRACRRAARRACEVVVRAPPARPGRTRSRCPGRVRACSRHVRPTEHKHRVRLWRLLSLGPERRLRQFGGAARGRYQLAADHGRDLDRLDLLRQKSLRDKWKRRPGSRERRHIPRALKAVTKGNRLGKRVAVGRSRAESAPTNSPR